MKFYFEQPYSILFLIAALVLAFGLTLLLYRVQKENTWFSKSQTITLAVLRFLGLFIVMVLLLEPAIELNKRYTQKPVLIVAFDNSESVQHEVKTSEELINKAKQAFPGFETEFWSFGEISQKSDLLTASELHSDYGKLFQTVQDQYLGKTIGAMILIGDGLFNSGIDPVFAAAKLPFPVFTVGVGDSTSRADASILKVTTNPTTYLENSFPVEINLMYRQFSGKQSVLTIWEDDKLVHKSEIAIPGNEYFKQEVVRIQASKPGLHRYRASVDEFADEQNTSNNSFEFSIQVIEQKQRILLLAHGAHPDLAALIKVIEPRKSYEYELITDSKTNFNPENYDLFILHQLPDKTTANSPSIQAILKSKRPVLWILGHQSSLSVLNNLSLGFAIGNNQGYEMAYPAPNNGFNLFTTERYWAEQARNWPPLQVPFADIQLKGDWQVLLNQQLRQVDTNRPLLFLGRPVDTKLGVVLGEGIWQWRVQDYIENASFEQFDNMMLKIINYLIIKPGEDNFTVYYKPRYAEDEDVVLSAELLNDSYQNVVAPDVKLTLSSENGLHYSYVFDKTDSQYQLNMGHLSAGTYSFDASVNWGEKVFREHGSFSVDKVQLEQINTQADFNLLYQLSASTGGRFFNQDQFGQLTELLNQQKELSGTSIWQQVYLKFISLKFLFILLFLLLSLEWFLRKYWGSY
ncbi:MAG: hypothetical protein ACK5JD_15675 [Mangrovibacterium sp.]